MTLRRAVTFVSAVALLVLVGITAYAWANGVRAYAVDSGSMSPTFNTGALVVDLPVTPATVFHIGDVITFHPTPGYTATHRIAAIGPEGITTKGDANPSSDVGFIQPSMIAGRVAFSVPYGGFVVVFFQHPVGVVGLLLVLLALLGVWQLTDNAPKPRPTEPVGGEDAR
jgi:signal peptidase I